MVVNYVSEVVSRETIRLQQNAFIQSAVFNCDCTVNFIIKRCCSARIDVLTDNILFASSEASIDFFLAQVLAWVIKLERYALGSSQLTL